MRTKIRVKLRSKERELLRRLISRGRERARKITRCRILLLADEGKSDNQIMEALKVARNTIRTVYSRYVQEGLASAIEEKPRSGAPTKFNGRLNAKITALACSEPPEGRGRWTLRLLADRVVELEMADSISHQTVKRILKKTNLSLT